MKLTKSIVAAAVLSVFALTASAAGKTGTGHAHVLRVSAAQAKTLAADYDGTSVYFANHSKDPMIIDCDDLDLHEVLPPHTGDLAQSDRYFRAVDYLVTNYFTNEIVADDTVANPGTVDIYDIYNAKAAHSAKVSAKASI